nr:peptide-methionine (R)-S-oxide reductase [uncultured Methanobrevibacter sp.]
MTLNPTKNLSLESYQVTSLAMNEDAFTGKYVDFDEEGIYLDITNNEELFSSKDKIKTNSGFACFSKPIHENAIDSLRDFSYGMVRLEIRASKSGIHLGYKRRNYYEINSAALKFIHK